MNWILLKSKQDLEQAIRASEESPILLFKHSTRCSISSTALNRLERGWKDDTEVKAYFLDLISHRDVSAAIEANLGVQHQSPQALVVKNGKCIYDASHMAINASEILGVTA